MIQMAMMKVKKILVTTLEMTIVILKKIKIARIKLRKDKNKNLHRKTIIMEQVAKE